MATLVLGAAGAALGSAVGGSFLGLSSAVIGRAIGATLGRALDQRLLGPGSDAVETGKMDRLRLTGASEGAAIPLVFGRYRMAGQVIWASDFLEHTTTSGGGKGAPPSPKVTEYSYTVSLAVALCEGEVSGIGRVWADGEEITTDEINLRVYSGREDQLPDPKITAVEGEGHAPAYRGIAYVVLEDLELGRFGNRVPQLSFEVIRPTLVSAPGADLEAPDLADAVQGVALLPGTGEYALARRPVTYSAGLGESRIANVNSGSGQTDFVTSLDTLDTELPQVRAVSLVVSWFGNDLRAGHCQLKPKVEQTATDGDEIPWQVSGILRNGAEVVVQKDDKPVYGGTPADMAVIEAIQEMNARGYKVMFYPFILMEQLAGNGLPDPYSDAEDQPILPWRGRITTDKAPGQPGSVDGTSEAEADVAAFFGSAGPADFAPVQYQETLSERRYSGIDNPEDYFTLSERIGTIAYSGPQEWSYRRFILHYASLCAAAGGVSAFCIGSELRGLTQIRGAGNSFPTVQALRDLTADVRAILGPDTKISYAADWSEYFGYHPQDGSNDVWFHLDPLWADPNIDFIGIDNYIPLSDWRAGRDHLDAQYAPAIYDLDYLRGNIEGGEGFDWYYHSPEARAAQIRTPIKDTAHGEDWVFRVKDLRGWWENRHFNRPGGVRKTTPTAWEPGLKPIWFTELGCPAVDNGSNRPNVFYDPKSSESSLPYHSNGLRDDLIQKQFLRAQISYWDAARNPVHEDTGVQMIDMSRCHVWAWDARPWPAFPNRDDLWSDGGNYQLGHWLNGRASLQTLAAVVREICLRSGVDKIDVSQLYGIVRGYLDARGGDARAALQSLSLIHGFDVIERDGVLQFLNRDRYEAIPIDPERVAVTDDMPRIEQTRGSAAETAGRVRLNYVGSEGEFRILGKEAVFPDERTHTVAQSEVEMSLRGSEAQATVERWLAEARVARDTVRLALPPSKMDIGAGDVIDLGSDQDPAQFRIDRVEQAEYQLVEAVRVEPGVYAPKAAEDDIVLRGTTGGAAPVYAQFMDLPLMQEDQVPHAPHLAVCATPWSGPVAAYSSGSDNGYALNRILEGASVMGVTLGDLHAAPSGLQDRGAALQVRLSCGQMSSADWAQVLNGANLAAIGDGSPGNWELFQFRSADLVAPNTYELTGRLRGQFGTDVLMPSVWPASSVFVLINDAQAQVALPYELRDLPHHYRIGPTSRPISDPSYQHQVHAFQALGLRPLSPVHLRATQSEYGTEFSWIRRTRISGDSWTASDVPLGEDGQLYELRVVQNGTVIRTESRQSPDWQYSAEDQIGDGITGLFEVQVAQVSQAFGAGPSARLVVSASP